MNCWWCVVKRRTVAEIFSWRSSVLGFGVQKQSTSERKLHSVCRKWTTVQQRDESMASYLQNSTVPSLLPE